MTTRVTVSITQALPVCFLKLFLQKQHTFLPSCMIGNNSTCRLKLLTYLFQLLVKSTCPSMPCRCSKNLPPQQQTSPNKLIQPQHVELETPHNFPSPTYVWPSNNNCMPAGRDIAVGTWMNWTFFLEIFGSWPWFHVVPPWCLFWLGSKKRVVWFVWGELWRDTPKMAYFLEKKQLLKTNHWSLQYLEYGIGCRILTLEVAHKYTYT